jgi:hypothetical protein
MELRSPAYFPLSLGVNRSARIVKAIEIKMPPPTP